MRHIRSKVFLYLGVMMVAFFMPLMPVVRKAVTTVKMTEVAELVTREATYSENTADIVLS